MSGRDTAPVEVGERYSVEIEDLGSEGDGVARIGSFVVFVPDADLGERVDIRIEEVGENHATASVVEDDEGAADGEQSDDQRDADET
ncbi:TRAM domain-containing protein [Halorussus ruber]|uniref:TRAM domain-containing protein n=1 Tax=Halorussus ruber TaxID=1126238 RepID=UPI0010927CFD|nr:TRAM domain-containing protein [Halorussus ruber]